MSQYSRIFTALALVLVAAPLFAQDIAQNGAAAVTVAAPQASEPAPVAAPVADRAPAAGPTMQSSTVGVRANLGQPAPVNAPAAPAYGRSPALMIVGVAALIVGAVVGGSAGTIVMIIGGVMGLVGLWNYLQ